MNYKIYQPCKRVVNVYDKEFYYSFPKMIFWKKDKNLYCGYMSGEEVCLPTCDNIGYDFKVCLGDFESSDLNELIQRFWQSKFSALLEPQLEKFEATAKLNLNDLDMYDYKTDNSSVAYNYVVAIDKRCVELEYLIKTNPEFAYRYARNIIKGRWLEIEDMMKTDLYYTFYYATDVVRERWLEAEDIIKKDNYYWTEYKNHFNINE